MRDSILMQACYVGESSTLSNVVMDKGVLILNGRNISGYKTYPVIIRKGTTV